MTPINLNGLLVGAAALAGRSLGWPNARAMGLPVAREEAPATTGTVTAWLACGMGICKNQKTKLAAAAAQRHADTTGATRA
jgi:hypothetical protein